MPEQKQAAPLIERIENPKTQTQLRPKRIIHRNVEDIATSVDCSFIDLSATKKPSRATTPLVYVYIRPIDGDISKLVKGQSKIKHYRFDGIDSETLRKKFREATSHIHYINYFSPDIDIYAYHFAISHKKQIDTAIEDLHKKHIS